MFKILMVPLYYAIGSINLLKSEMRETFKYLLEKGSDYTIKNKFGDSCLEVAESLSWRHDFLDIVKEYEESKR